MHAEDRRLHTEVKTGREFIWFVATCTGAAIAAYAAKFHDTAFPSPAEWGQLGDFFGGLINPVVGIVSVVLLVRTLLAAREDAQMSRGQMETQSIQLQAQVMQLEREQKLSEIRKRLDGVISDWNAEMERPLGKLNVLHQGSSFREYAADALPARQFLYDTNLVGSQVNAREVDPRLHHAMVVSWNDRFETTLHLLDELQKYCDEYDAIANDSHMTDYYRHRVQLPLRAFKAVGIAGENEFARLGAPLKQRMYGLN